ncbi:MAG: hypothetical protein ABIA74_04575 [bacterium]
MLKNKIISLTFIFFLSLIYFQKTNAGRIRQKTKNIDLIKEEVQKETKQQAISIVKELEQQLAQESKAQMELMSNQMKKEFKNVLDNLQEQIKNKLTLASQKELNYELELHEAKKLLTTKKKNKLDKELQEITQNKRNVGW